MQKYQYIPPPDAAQNSKCNPFFGQSHVLCGAGPAGPPGCLGELSLQRFHPALQGPARCQQAPGPKPPLVFFLRRSRRFCKYLFVQGSWRMKGFCPLPFPFLCRVSAFKKEACKMVLTLVFSRSLSWSSALGSNCLVEASFKGPKRSPKLAVSDF